MKPAEFHYHRPTELAEALRLLHELGEETKVIAGGQSLLPIMNMRLAEPEHLVDITGIRELRQYTVDASTASYGAATTHLMIEHGLVEDVTHGLLPEAAAGIGYRAIRTRGTLAGSLAHADSSAEWPTVMSALDAAVRVASVRGQRRIPVRELLRGFFTTTLEPDELIVAVDVPRLGAGTRWGFHKLARKPGEFAESLAVALRGPEGDELWAGAARDTPVRLRRTEEAVARHSGGPLVVADLAEFVGADLDADGYPRQVHTVAVLRAIQTCDREETHV